MLRLVGRTLEFTSFHVLIRIADKISKLPRNSQPSDLERLYRENLALKTQIEAVRRELKIKGGPRPRVSVRTRAAQVFAYLITRGNRLFHKNCLSSSKGTVENWTAKFRRGPWPWNREQKSSGGRPSTADEIRELVIQLRTENPRWGVPKIHGTLSEMGIRVSKSTVRNILLEEGLLPTNPEPANWDRFKSSVKDALWAMDYLVVHTTKGAKLKVLITIDVATRELMDLHVHDGWAVDSQWTTMALNECMAREERRPQAVMHDREQVFADQLVRQLAVLEIEQRRTPPRQPLANVYAERAVLTTRWELLNHIRVHDAEELQWYLDEFRSWYNQYRVHQGANGRPPAANASEEPAAEVVSIDELRQRRLKRHEFAHGLLNGYELVEAGPEEHEDRWKAAA